MPQDITYVGLDVHKESITGAALPPGFDECPDEQTIPCDFSRLLKWLKQLRRKWGELRICYEASGAGYVLFRYLTERGFSCEVVAPSLIPKKPGDRRKTDRRDARKLAVLYRAGALTMVSVSSSVMSPSTSSSTVLPIVHCIVSRLPPSPYYTSRQGSDR